MISVYVCIKILCDFTFIFGKCWAYRAITLPYLLRPNQMKLLKNLTIVSSFRMARPCGLNDICRLYCRVHLYLQSYFVYAFWSVRLATRMVLLNVPSDHAREGISSTAIYPRKNNTFAFLVTVRHFRHGCYNDGFKTSKNSF